MASIFLTSADSLFFFFFVFLEIEIYSKVISQILPIFEELTIKKSKKEKQKFGKKLNLKNQRIQLVLEAKMVRLNKTESYRPHWKKIGFLDDNILASATFCVGSNIVDRKFLHFITFSSKVIEI